VGVADVGTDRGPAVLVDDPAEPVGDGLPRLRPRRRLEAVAPAHEGLAQAVGVLVQVLERGPLRAQVAVAEHVEAVAPDADDLAVADGDVEAAAGLAQRTGALHG